MRFDRGLRSVMMKPYPVGYVAMSTDDFNGEDPRCQFGGVKDSGTWLAREVLPTIIELQVRLIPVWIDNLTARAKLDQYASCSVYLPQSVYSLVRVDAIGVGQYQKGSGEEKIPFVGSQILDYHLQIPKPYLYEKRFLVQPVGRDIQWESQRVTSLWAYGAQQVGDDIHPLVFTLESLRDETKLQATSLLHWRDRGISPTSQGGVGNEGVIFQEGFEQDQTRTFLESIAAGMSAINLELGIDETGTALTVLYRSYRLSNNCLFFKREE